MALHSTNKIFELIKADIDANFDPGYAVHVRNMYDVPRDAWSKYFRQVNTIMIIFDEENYERETNETMEGTLRIVFFVIEQIMAKSATKFDYLSDTFRDYLTEDGFGKKWTSLQAQYSNERFEPFYPQSKVLVEILQGGLVRYEFAGYMNFKVYKHG